MKRILFLLILCCLVAAQNYDEAVDAEAPLDEFLNSTPPPELDVPADYQATNPVEETQEIRTPTTSRNMDISQSSYESAPTPQQSEPVSRPHPTRKKTRKQRVNSRPVPQITPDMEKEARIQETPDIPNFSHRAHIEDIGAECVQCHQTLFSESVRGIKTGPPMKEICSQCHNGTDAPSELLAGFSNEKKYVKTRLPLFSHTTHIQHTEKCIVCHNDIYGDLKNIATPPPMTRCTGCHNDHRANSSCNVCHENPNKLKPKSHTSQWVYRFGHGKNARINQKECRGCHVERECNACHRGQSSFEVHKPGYRYSHGMDARQRIANCGYCHDAQFSCAQCHEGKR